MSDEPSDDLNEFINSIGQTLDIILNGKGVEKDKSLRKNGFVLLIYPYGAAPADPRCNYISNGTTAHDLVERFRTQIKQFEKKLQ